MNCFAIWYKRKSSAKKGELHVDLHVNLWKLIVKKGNRKGKHRHFLDIGIMIPDPSNIANINIYTPFTVAKEEIGDLGKCFRENSELVAAIFNEPYSVKLPPQNKTLPIEDSENRTKFYIYMIDLKNDIKEIRRAYGGSIISIKVKSGAETKPIYYRIRITSDKLERLSTFYKPESQWFESHFTNTELIDFRVNEERNLDSSLSEEMHGDGKFDFENVDLFIMREFTCDYVYSHDDRIRSRRLEEELWGSYVGNDCKCDKIIAYHWKWGKETGSNAFVTGFNAFVKYKFTTSDKKTIARFIAFLLGVALLGGFLGTLLMNLINM